jgi:hypothetical protein
VLGAGVRQGDAVAEAGGVEPVTREQLVVETAEIRDIGVPLEELGGFVERGRALGALHVQRDAGGIEERSDFSGHAKRNVGLLISEAGEGLAREKENRRLSNSDCRLPDENALPVMAKRADVTVMKRLLGLGLFWAGMLAAAAAEENFSRAVRAEDFSAAGLGKLSPAELARLDTLVRDYKSGALIAARREAEAAAQARAAAETRAAQAEAKAESVAKEKKSEPGLLAKAKVMLTPGTKVEYETIETRIAGDFKGWDARTIFTLENGTRWKILNGGSYYTPAVASPKVTVTPASFGSFWLDIDGVNQRVRVAPFGAK